MHIFFYFLCQGNYSLTLVQKSLFQINTYSKNNNPSLKSFNVIKEFRTLSHNFCFHNNHNLYRWGWVNIVCLSLNKSSLHLQMPPTLSGLFIKSTKRKQFPYFTMFINPVTTMSGPERKQNDVYGIHIANFLNLVLST